MTLIWNNSWFGSGQLDLSGGACVLLVVLVIVVLMAEITYKAMSER